MKIVYLFSAMILLLGVDSKAQFLELTPTGFKNIQEPTLDYIVLNIGKTSQQDLYKNTLSYLQTLYSHPDAVLTTIDNEQITVNGLAKDQIRDPYVSLYYNLVFKFKEGKIRMDMPIIELKNLMNDLSYRYLFISMEKRGFLNDKYGIWTKGKLRFPDAKDNLENFFNIYLANINTNATKKDDW